MRLGTSVSAAELRLLVGSLAASAACTEACTAVLLQFSFCEFTVLVGCEYLVRCFFLDRYRTFLLVPFTFFFNLSVATFLVASNGLFVKYLVNRVLLF